MIVYIYKIDLYCIVFQLHCFSVCLVVVKAFPQTPALDSDSILFLENRTCLGLVMMLAIYYIHEDTSLFHSTAF